MHDGRGGGGSIYARALYIIYINGRGLQYTRARAMDGEHRKPGGSAVFLHPAGAPVPFSVRIAGGPAPSARPDPCTVAALAPSASEKRKDRGKSPRRDLFRCISATTKIIEKISENPKIIVDK